MPEGTLDRYGQGVDAHLAAAVEFIAIAESGDAERSAYEHAADEIKAAMDEDPTLSQQAVADRVGKSRRWVRDLVQWRTSGQRGAPFADPENPSKRSAARDAERIAAERPDAFADAYEQAPPEAKRRIAERISHAPEVRSEARKRDHEAEQRRRPESIPPRADTALFNFEQRLVGARRYLRDALDLVNGIDQPGDDEDILELLGMLKQMVDAVDESYRSGQSLEAWAWELYERSAD